MKRLSGSNSDREASKHDLKDKLVENSNTFSYIGSDLQGSSPSANVINRHKFKTLNKPVYDKMSRANGGKMDIKSNPTGSVGDLSFMKSL